MSEYIWVEYKLVVLEPLSLREKVAAVTLSVEIAVFAIIGIWFLARLV